MRLSRPSDQQVWVGMIELEPLAETVASFESPVAGAFTTFACIATGRRQFRAAASTYAMSEGWRLVGTEDVEPADQRLRTSIPDRDVLAVIEAVQRDGRPRTPDAWDVFESEEE